MSRVEIVLKMSIEAMQAAQVYGRKHKLSFDEAVSSMILARREEADRAVVNSEIAQTLTTGVRLFWVIPGQQETAVRFDRYSGGITWVNGQGGNEIAFSSSGGHVQGDHLGWLEIPSNT